MSATTLRTLRQRAIDRLYNTSRFFPRRGTATGGSTTTLIDTAALGLAGSTADRFNYQYLKIAVDAGGAGAAPEGETRMISEGGYSLGSKQLTVESAFTAAVAFGDTYEIHPHFHPDEVDAVINEYGRNLHLTYFFPLTCVLLLGDDNDMENSTANAFTGVGAAGTKVTASGHFFDTQALQVNSSGANGYVQVENAASSVNWDVVAGRTYYAAARARVIEGAASAATGALVVWDQTNNVEIDRATVNQSDWMELIVPFTPAAGVEMAQFRLMSTSATAGDETFWDDFQVYVAGPYTYPTPTWLTRKDQMVAVVAFPPGAAGPASDFDYRSGEQRYRTLPWSVGERSLFFGQELSLHVDVPSGWRPYIVAKRPMPTLSTDTSTAPLDDQAADGLIEGVLGELKGRLVKHTTGAESDRYARESATHIRNYWQVVNDLEGKRERHSSTERVWVGRG